MISCRKIMTLMGAEPFRPFRITTVSGRTFDIRRPDTIAVGRSAITICTFFSDDPMEARLGQAKVPLVETVAIEFLTPASQPQPS